MRKRLHVFLSTDCERMPLAFVSHSLFLTLSFTRQTVSYTRRSNKEGYVFNIHIYISYNHTFLPFLSRTYKITKSHSFNRKFRIQANIMILLRGEMCDACQLHVCIYTHTHNVHTYIVYTDVYCRVAYLHGFAVSRNKYLHESEIRRERDSLTILYTITRD